MGWAEPINSAPYATVTASSRFHLESSPPSGTTVPKHVVHANTQTRPLRASRVKSSLASVDSSVESSLDDRASSPSCIIAHDMTQNELSLDPVSSTSRFIAHDLTSGELSLAPTNPLSHSNTITGCRLAKIHVDPPHSEEIDDMSVTGVDPVIAADISKLFKTFRGAQLTRPYPSFPLRVDTG